MFIMVVKRIIEGYYRVQMVHGCYHVTETLFPESSSIFVCFGFSINSSDQVLLVLLFCW